MGQERFDFGALAAVFKWNQAARERKPHNEEEKMQQLNLRIRWNLSFTNLEMPCSMFEESGIICMIEILSSNLHQQ